MTGSGFGLMGWPFKPYTSKIMPIITLCNSGHSDFLYYIAYSVGDKREYQKVCKSCYTNEDCFNNKDYILEIRTLEGKLVWERPEKSEEGNAQDAQ